MYGEIDDDDLCHDCYCSDVMDRIDKERTMLTQAEADEVPFMIGGLCKECNRNRLFVDDLDWEPTKCFDCYAVGQVVGPSGEASGDEASGGGEEAGEALDDASEDCDDEEDDYVYDRSDMVPRDQDGELLRESQWPYAVVDRAYLDRELAGYEGQHEQQMRDARRAHYVAIRKAAIEEGICYSDGSPWNEGTLWNVPEP